jgi:hypothetical protein
MDFCETPPARLHRRSRAAARAGANSSLPATQFLNETARPGIAPRKINSYLNLNAAVQKSGLALFSDQYWV